MGSVLGALGSLGQLAFGTKPVQEWLSGCQTRLVAGPMLPGNHDLVKGIRTAHLCALDHVARRYRQELYARPASEQGEKDRLFAANLERFLAERLKLAHDRGIDHDTLGAEDIGYVLDHLVDPGTSEGYGEVAAHARAAAEATALAELERDAGYTLPPLFRSVFAAPGGWHDAFALFVTEQLKTNERFRSIFLAGKLVDIKRAITSLGESQARIVAAHPELSGFLGSIDARLGRIEAGIDSVKAGVDRIETGLGRVLRNLLSGTAGTTVVIRGGAFAALVGATVFAGWVGYDRYLDDLHRQELAALEATRKQELAEAIAAAKGQARKEVEAAKLEASLKDQIIAAKDQAIEALGRAAVGPKGEASRQAIDALAAGNPEPAAALTAERAEAKASEALRATNLAEAKELRLSAAESFIALAFLLLGTDNVRSATAFRRAAELGAEKIVNWILIAGLTLSAEIVSRIAKEQSRSSSLEKIGDVLLQEGDRPGALRAYRESLGIRDTLAAKDPGNTLWQRDRALSLDKIGDVLLQEGDRPGALRAYRESLGIRDTLAAKDPGNTEWQRDLIASNVKLAEQAEGAEEKATAREHYATALRVAERLAAEGKLAPVDGWMMDELKARLAGVDE